ncbi:MAG: 3-phosphoshikimate 1-carboxyvinyltransferase, partial [Actinomycetota bacterium]|nr:3-phosphoshikimate 1-carboxyvinyltransferase [Actinomycetota bacterium]
MNDRTISYPPEPFQATVAVPGDKSLSHRALILGAMAAGRSRATGLAPGADGAATVAALRTLGMSVDAGWIDSPGVEGWSDPGAPVDCANSGTTMRLLAGALAGCRFATTLTGDASLLARPMRRLVGPLGALGASVTVAEPAGTAPVTVHPVARLHGATVAIDLPSAQLRTAVALAALQAEGATVITGPVGYRDHTERWLEALGRGARQDAGGFRIDPGPVPAAEYRIPGDPSSAAVLWAVAALRRGSTVTTPGVSLNPGRIGFLQILERFGAVISAEVTGSVLGDPVGSVTVTGGSLFGVEVPASLAAATLDELILVGVLGAVAEGTTMVRGAAELRTKESDRIAGTVDLIRRLGGGAETTADGFAVVGIGRLDPGTVRSRGDHRLAMAAAVAAVAADGAVLIEDADAVSASWPGFYE